MTVSLAVDTSLLVDGQAANAGDVTLPISNLKNHLEDTLNGVQAFDRISFGAAESLTIASGAISPTKSNVVVDTEGGASSDNLDTINNGADGRFMWIRCANAARQVVIRHNGGGTGNIRTATGQDYTLTDTNVEVLLLHNGSNWLGAIMPSNAYLNVGEDTTLTISSGAVTRTRTRHLLATEGSADTDDLDTINGGLEGDLIILQQAGSDAVRVRSAVGNIRLADKRHRWLVPGQAAALWLVYDGSNWLEHQASPAPPHPTQRRHIEILSSGASPFVDQIGLTAPTVTGVATVSNDTDSVYTNFEQTAATINTFAGVSSAAYVNVRRQYNPKFGCILRTVDITAIRLWIGLSSAIVTSTNDTVGVAFIGFRWGTTGGEANWIGVCHDGSSQDIVTPLLSGSIAANTVYKLEFEVNDAAGTVNFKVNDGPTSTLLSNLPAAATELGIHARQITLAGAKKSFKLSRLWVESD